MEKHPLSIKFKRGDIVNALGQIGVVLDVLESSETDNACLYVRFVHNLGNARPYDMLELSPGRTLGVERWTLASRAELEAAIAKRRDRLEAEIDELLQVARERERNSS